MRYAPVREPVDSERVAGLLVHLVEAGDTLLGGLEEGVALALVRRGLVRLLVHHLVVLPLLVLLGGLDDADLREGGGHDGGSDSDAVQHWFQW
jgi:hypothetical protein